MATCIEQAMVLQLTRIAWRPRPVITVFGVAGTYTRRDFSTRAVLTRKKDVASQTKQSTSGTRGSSKRWQNELDERSERKASSKALDDAGFEDRTRRAWKSKTNLEEYEDRPRRVAKAWDEEHPRRTFENSGSTSKVDYDERPKRPASSKARFQDERDEREERDQRPRRASSASSKARFHDEQDGREERDQRPRRASPASSKARFQDEQDESEERDKRPRRASTASSKARFEDEENDLEERPRREPPKEKGQSIKDVKSSTEFSPFSSQAAGFASLSLSKQLVEKLEEVGLTMPTEVQASAIPALLQGHDAALQSYTGSGKTLAYLLPILSKIGPLAGQEETALKGGVEAVVVAPSRELAMQIVREAEKLLGEENRRLVQQLIGGANMKRQAEALKKNKPLLIVGTPGRISEFSRAGKLHTHGCKFLILDEADQILSMKYRSDMKRILEHVGFKRSADGIEVVNPGVKVQRQTVLVSATMPPAVLKAAQEWGHKPLLLKANSAAEKVSDMELKDTVTSTASDAGNKKQSSNDDIRGAKESLPPNLAHYYVIAPARHRVSTMKSCIIALEAKTVLVFMNFTQRLKDTVFKLQAGGLDVACLHGEKGKLGRANTLAAFRNQKLRVLVVSEVGARGLDVPECDLVVNLELPTDATHYAHRAGRTGRLGRQGTVLSICEEREQFVLEKFEKQLGLSIKKCEVSFGTVSLDIEDSNTEN